MTREREKEWILNEGQFAAEKGTTVGKKEATEPWLLGCGKGNAAEGILEPGWKMGKIRWEDYGYPVGWMWKAFLPGLCAFQFEIWEKGNEGEVAGISPCGCP